MTIGGKATGGEGAGTSDLADLLRRVAARDEAAFAALYRADKRETLWSGRPYPFQRRCGRGGASGGLRANLGKGRRIRSGEGIAARLDGDHRPQSCARRSAARRGRFRSRIMPEGFEPAAEAGRSAGLARTFGGVDRVARLSRKLDEEKRAAVLLAYYRGASREALAKRFGRPVPTIKTWLHRSLAQLRDCLAS